MSIDFYDKLILQLLQRNASLPLAQISKAVGLSITPCWNRIRKLEESGIIEKRAAILSREKLGFPIVVFLSLSVSRHNLDWTGRFLKLIKRHEKIVEVHRLTGSGSDYMLKILAESVADYDKFQQYLIGEIEFTSMSSSISLQELKHEVELPLPVNDE